MLSRSRALRLASAPLRAPHPKGSPSFFTWKAPDNLAAPSPAQLSAYDAVVDRLVASGPSGPSGEWVAAIEEGVRLRSVKGLERLLAARADTASRELLVPMMQRALGANKDDTLRVLVRRLFSRHDFPANGIPLSLVARGLDRLRGRVA